MKKDISKMLKGMAETLVLDDMVIMNGEDQDMAEQAELLNVEWVLRALTNAYILGFEKGVKREV